jgi:hypothetical protein
MLKRKSKNLKLGLQGTTICKRIVRPKQIFGTLLEMAMKPLTIQQLVMQIHLLNVFLELENLENAVRVVGLFIQIFDF